MRGETMIERVGESMESARVLESESRWSRGVGESWSHGVRESCHGNSAKICSPANAGVAQLVEQLIRNQQVISSSLIAGSKILRSIPGA